MITIKRIGTTAALAALAFLALPLTLAAQQGMGKGRQGGTGLLATLSRPKLVTMFVIGLVVMVLLLTRKMKNPVKVPFLLLSTFLYGIAAILPVKLFAGFSMHPSPVCSATKYILYAFRPPMIAMLLKFDNEICDSLGNSGRNEA